MGDDLKLRKDKRHRSSSSLAGLLEGTRSERKLDIRASIAEIDDQFALAEARCDDLEEKINLVKSLKKKRKQKKRSMTRISETQQTENVPFISVRTQPKKRVLPVTTRLRRLELAPSPARTFQDAATVEQHRMIRGYPDYKSKDVNRKVKQSNADVTERVVKSTATSRRTRVGSGDIGGVPRKSVSNDTSYLDYEPTGNTSAQEEYNAEPEYEFQPNVRTALSKKSSHISKKLFGKESRVNEEMPVKTAASKNVRNDSGGRYKSAGSPWHLPVKSGSAKVVERPVVELFSSTGRPTAFSQPPNKHRSWHAGRDAGELRHLSKAEEEFANEEDEDADQAELKKQKARRCLNRVRYRSRRYEMPTVASQMKQADMRYYHGIDAHSNYTNIPFIVSKSTAPSHHIGVNIQQVLNGLKIQQPLSGIPFTIAYHMGLGYIPYYSTKPSTKKQEPCLDSREMNAIRLGRRLLRLPSYKCMSYNRLLALYREGDGMVSRFLRSVSRPHYFYTSMYNLNTREDLDGATSKGHGAASQDAKQRLAQYASLYREYEQVERKLREGPQDRELERRRDEIARELALREDHIRLVMQEQRMASEPDGLLRTTASVAGDEHHHSTFKLTSTDHLRPTPPH